MRHAFECWLSTGTFVLRAFLALSPVTKLIYAARTTTLKLQLTAGSSLALETKMSGGVVESGRTF